MAETDGVDGEVGPQCPPGGTGEMLLFSGGQEVFLWHAGNVAGEGGHRFRDPPILADEPIIVEV